MLNQIKNENTFKGSYHGLLKNVVSSHKYPLIPVKTCVYADKLMMEIVAKSLASPKKQKRLNITLSEKNNSPVFMLEMTKENTKKSIPIIFRILKNILNLSDPTFWNILKNKKLEKIHYEFTKKDVEFFENIKTTTATNSTIGNSDEIFFGESFSNFKKSLFKHFTSKENQSWLKSFFTD